MYLQIINYNNEQVDGMKEGRKEGKEREEKSKLKINEFLCR